MTSGRDAEVMQLHHAGCWPRRISIMLGVPRSRVYRVLATANVTPNPSPARLGCIDREEVALMLRAGERHHAIAEWFGVSQPRISQIASQMGLRRRGRTPRPMPTPAP